MPVFPPDICKCLKTPFFLAGNWLDDWGPWSLFYSAQTGKYSDDTMRLCTLTGQPGYLAFSVKPLCMISASCWTQVGCETYLLQPRCACNPSLSPLPSSCSGGCLEHSLLQCVCVCLRVCVWVYKYCTYLLACMFTCLSFSPECSHWKHNVLHLFVSKLVWMQY